MNIKILNLILTFTLILVLGVVDAQSQYLTYNGSFTNRVNSTTAQCQAWNAYRATLLSSYKYKKVTLKNNVSTTSYTVTDTAEVRKIAEALRTASTYSNTTNNWNISLGCGGGCGGPVVELHINQTSCNCGTGGSLRPAIMNLNWGGIGVTCNTQPSQILTLEFEYAVAPVDAGFSKVLTLDGCDNKQDIKADLFNYGTKKLDSVDVYWSLDGVLQPVIKYNRPYVASDTLKSFGSNTLTLKSGQSFTDFTNYKIKVWTDNPNGMQDTVSDNDTQEYVLNFLGSPNGPSSGSFTRCGNGKVDLTGKPDEKGDSLIWSTKNQFNQFFAIGEKALSPYLTKSDTMLLQSYRMPEKDTADNGLTGNTRFTRPVKDEGGMFSITAKNSDVVFTNFATTVLNSNSTKYSVYIKNGSFVGSEQNASAWTLLESGETTPFTIGINYDIVTLPLNIVVPNGKTVSIYVSFENNQPVFGGGSDINNDQFQITSGSFLQGLFGSNLVQGGFLFNHIFEYYAPNCAAATVAVKVPVEIIKLAIGADLEEGSTFEGTYAGGTITNPDIVAEGDEIVYNISNPTNYPNTSYGTTWEVSKTSVETIFGNPENMGTLVFVPASGSTDGTYSYTAHDNFTDSTLKVSITITDLNTSCDTIIERYIFVAPRVKPGFGLPAALCQGDAISFINTSTISSGGITYKWEFGDGDTSIAPNTSHKYLAPGNYDVKLITTSVPYGYITDSTLTITVNETPQANFSRTNACEGFNVELVNTTTYGGAGNVVYDWDFGDGSTHSSNKDETKIYSTPNGYKVTLVADVAGCKSSRTKTVYQFSTPKVDFTAPSGSVCNHSEVNLMNQSSLLSGTMGAYWDFGNNKDYSNNLNGQISYSTPNTFNVKLKMISEFGCSDSLTKQVVVSEGASAKFDFDLACIVNATNFTFTGDAPSSQTPLIVWTFDNEGQGAGASTSHKWQSLGTKTVKLKVSLNNGCDDSTTQVIEVMDQPKVDFAYSGKCESDAVVFQNNSSVGTGNVDYLWDFGDNTSSTKVSPKHSYTAGSYTVKLKAGLAGGCSDSLSKVIDVNANPICDFTVTEKYIWGHRGFDFTPTNTSYPHYRWTFGDGGKSSDASPEYQYFNDDEYSVKLFARNAAGCECEKTIKHEVSGTVGINETSLQGVSVYPNPTTGKLTVELPEVGTSYTIKVMNVIGKTVQVGEYTNTTGTVELNIGDQANGIYLIKITSNNKTKTVKVNLLD